MELTDRVLRLPEVLKRTGLSRSSLYAYIRAGFFPKPISLGARSVGWIEKEVNDWIRGKIAGRYS